MIEKLKLLSKNKKIVIALKVIFCTLIVAWLCNCIYINSFDNYFSCIDYNYQNNFSEPVFAEGTQRIDQTYLSNGNVLSNIQLYFENVSDSELTIMVNDNSGNSICSKTINIDEYTSNSWNTIALDCNKLKRNETYHVVLAGDNLSYVALSTENADTKVFGECNIDGTDSSYTLAIGLTETYRYMMLGYGLQLMVSLLFLLVLAFALCYTILNIEKIFKSFVQAEKKTGFLYALYFSVYTVLLFNPIDTIRTEATKFARVIGAGFNEGVDVTKRISNFSHWFIYFAIAFVLYFLLANYLRNREFEGDDKKTLSLLDDVIIVANLILGLRCITFFANEASESNIFYYSDFIITAIILLAIIYVVFGLKKKICLERFEAIIIAGWMVALPVSIVITDDWALGRGFMGIQVVISILTVLIIGFSKIDWNSDRIGETVNAFTIMFSLIPFCTSLYIEFIVWLNQREIFVTHLRRYYFCAIIIGIIITTILALIWTKKNKVIKNWKTFTYPALIFGFVCSWQQIAVASERTVDLFETANSSILIGDFLNFGDIPIIEHYGGHMMTGVWEAFVYAILNKDFEGALFSPYANYIAVVIVILFFILIKHIWNEDAALIVTLFLPFYDSISYWGLGILTALAAMNFVKKNSYVSAGLFWFACIWCALYRLDLGFAFVVACILSLGLYIVINKNINALKQLAITIGVWGILGLSIWSGICIAKDINPINRLLEFLYINLSNQDWAYSSIGDTGLVKFAFTYIFIPFLSVIALLYLVFSKKLREELHDTKWVMIMIFGFSYFYNFSRGLVRHSLAEDSLSSCLWSGLFFLAMFFATIKYSWKLFIPAFTMCMLISNLLQYDTNFSEESVANLAVGKVGNFTETWNQLQGNSEVIKRIEWTDDLRKTIQGYQVVIDGLLDEDETFVDFINKTSIYPLLNREDPVYVSQSPMQLSGQFTQEEFVKEMTGVPIVLMPYDNGNYLDSAGLDDVSNFYRYYKVVEYIYQNYVPLCTYENQYAVWCLADRYDQFSVKLQHLKESGTDIKNSIATAENIGLNSVELISNSDGSLNINAKGTDTIVSELQNVIDTTDYIGKILSMAIEYDTDVKGLMQIYYTTELGEEYSGEKVVSYDAQTNSGVAKFTIPITEYTRIRFDTPEGSSVKIKSFKVGTCNCDFAKYGYDGPYLQDDGVSYSYLPYVHRYGLSKLPLIWAKGDSENSADNNVVADLSFSDGLYQYDFDDSDKGTDGNYLKVSLNYNGNDQGGKIKSDDETIDATIRVGKYVNGTFEPEYYYTFTVEEGIHDYMFRVSNDYYWYIGETDSVQLECAEQLIDVNMQILEGD